MAHLPRVLTTRPLAQADRLLQPLAAAGYTAVNIPLLAIEPLPVSPQQKQWLLDLDCYHRVVVISPSAAEQLLEVLDDFWPQWPVGVQWYTVGAGTRQRLEQAGIVAECPLTGDRSEDLLALDALQDLSGQRVLLVKGEGGRPLLEQALVERGARVDVLPLYQRVKPRLKLEQLQDLLTGDYPVMVVTSGEGLEQYLEFAQQYLPSAEQVKQLQQQRWLLLPSHRLVRQAETLGFQQLICTEGAGAEAILDSLQQLQRLATD
ncbi:uroporphyrinogen-III synthase [Marinospirillum alkaliphilum]|uniref:Uroporphyrinogen-III synthase n=1 Tax=Marinospirillum alkaliphilum DSM 21637 TaxID=1122209 RepID=A0A1K1WSG8_9GAMM|nr:uroporphyrinogen-III synthase [Marinospirillum alkaliphilum]SFX40344.1 uroporphyrinogen-III synthase [Marinospirillum alkaliphilum DSM 21637]